ncbi:hypothetical protein CMQ_3825 [Grosmannia clavigera kw1407]|uniref:Uncharacterized protein n=1 Tax=Grosmannia clavigera (strain kw1407 / UAMH 11150) TaxID=655863 RepID=F0X9C2_GROCL|nr:uncharacterized protein CMQ_3825 [Grosmannia clavigera kw1407]EFX05756.1 hypothetical protein CMQ_3825 [Grosmannia clavigera kw1407]
MATRETADLGEAHLPKHESIKAFGEIEHELRKQLVHLRHDHDKHQPESFAAASGLSDHELASFTSHDLVLVRVASTAYGIILFGKLRIPALVAAAGGDEAAPAYVHFRAFDEGPNSKACFHSFYTREIDTPTDEGDGHLHTYQTLLPATEALEWF